MTTFLISYNQADRQWAEWIAWHIEEAGFATFVQAWDIRPGSNFVVAMQDATEKADRTVAVLSPDYLKAKFTQPEWSAAFVQDPTGERGILVPVRVREVDLRGIWVAIVYIDLVGLTQDEAKRALLDGIALGRAKPPTAPDYPGDTSRLTLRRPTPPAPVPPKYPVAEPIDKDPLADWSVCDVAETDDGGLAFLFRPESTRATELSQIQLTATKRQFVDKLLDRGSESSQAGDFQVALFESLIPNRIKGPLLQSSRLCVVVDENTAAYPWELLSEPSHDPTVPNFAVKSSLIRRFSTSTFRAAAIEKAKTLTALIVGDPSLTSHASLPGANYEALAISKLLGQHHGVERVRILTGTDSGAASVEIINALFAERYGIVHVAARGGFEHGRPGLLIGDNTWLTPGEFEQMPVLPNLVFINFGHLGRIDEPGLGWLGPLAAAYAAGLIRTGVPAVVVSGWVVDGAASITFGTQLYSAMLAGEPFAAAVRRARTQTYESHPGVNTWGAFQCYGSPDFSLIDSFAKERLVPDK